jgi:hypothetical protein
VPSQHGAQWHVCPPPLAVHVPPFLHGGLSQPVGWAHFEPDQPLWQLQVWLPPLATQLPYPQLGLLSQPVAWPQVSPDQPLLQLQLQGAFLDDWLPCCPQFFVHGVGGGGGGPCAPAHPAQHSTADTTVNAAARAARGITRRDRCWAAGGASPHGGCGLRVLVASLVHPIDEARGTRDCCLCGGSAASLPHPPWVVGSRWATYALLSHACWRGGGITREAGVLSCQAVSAVNLS